MPRNGRATAAAFATMSSTLRPGAGMTWMVISRDTSACHSLAAPLTRITAPVVIEARNVIMATTATSARPEMEFRGTSGVSKRGSGKPGARGGSTGGVISSASGLVIDVQPPIMQHQAARVVLIHQGDIMRGDDHGCPGFVEF